MLLVEDHPKLADVTAKLIELNGYTVVGPAHNIEEAMELVDRGPIDAALVDHGLPDGAGTMLVRHLIERKIACCVLSGYEPEDVKVPDSIRGVSWLLKPVSGTDLDRMLSTLCG